MVSVALNCAMNPRALALLWFVGLALGQATLVAPEAGRYVCSLSGLDFGNQFQFTPTGFALVPTATATTQPSVLVAVQLDGKNYLVTGMKSNNSGNYRFADNKLSFTSGVLSGIKYNYNVSHENGKVLGYHLEFAFSGGVHVCSKQAQRPVSLPALAQINGGLEGILSFEGDFNTVFDFELKSGRVLKRYPNAKFPHRIPGGSWVYSRYNPSDVLNPTLTLAGPDGQVLQYAKNFMGDGIASSSGKRAEFPQFTPGSDPVLSPDASRIAFIGKYSLRIGEGFTTTFQEAYALMVVNRKGQLLACIDDAAYGDLPSWTPDNRLVYTHVNGGLISSDAGFRTFKRIAASDSSRPAFSPDGKRLAFARTQELWLSQSDGSKAQKLLDLGQEIVHLAWAPDGKAIAVLTKNGLTSGRLRVALLNPQGTVAKLLSITNPYGQDVYTAAFHLSWWQPGAKPLPTKEASSNPSPKTDKPSAPGPPALELGRSYALSLQDQEPWELRLETQSGDTLEGTTVTTVQGDRADLETVWKPLEGVLDLLDGDDRVRCVFTDLQNGVLLGQATYTPAGEASKALGWCKLNTRP